MTHWRFSLRATSRRIRCSKSNPSKPKSRYSDVLRIRVFLPTSVDGWPQKRANQPQNSDISSDTPPIAQPLPRSRAARSQWPPARI